MGVAHDGLVHRDPYECKVKDFCAVSSIEKNVLKMRHLQEVRQLCCMFIVIYILQVPSDGKVLEFF